MTQNEIPDSGFWLWNLDGNNIEAVDYVCIGFTVASISFLKFPKV